MNAEPLRLYGFVGPGLEGGDTFTAQSVAKELDARAGAKSLDIFLSSGGGNVVEGLTIYAQIRRFPAQVTVHVDGVAASIASIIALAGSKLVMPTSAMLMIHRPWAGAFVAGNSPKLREQAQAVLKLAADLEVANDTMRGIYVASSRLSPVAVQKLMDDETWLTAEKAQEMGFATVARDVPSPAATARASVGRRDLDFLNFYQNTPGGLRTMRSEAALARLESLLTQQRVAVTASSARAVQAK